MSLILNASSECASAAAEPWWSTAAIAAGAALLGALGGATAGFYANLRLDDRRRRARSRLRRKAKIYTPVRAELVALNDQLAQEQHLNWGVARGAEADEFGPNSNGPQFHRWDRLVADGRGRTSASTAVREKVEGVLDAVDTLNKAHGEMVRAAKVAATRIYPEVTDKPLPEYQGPDSGSILPLVRDDAEPWGPFALNTHPEGQWESFREKLNADTPVVEARERIFAAGAELQRNVDRAIEALDEGMARIARKYEQEDAED